MLLVGGAAIAGFLKLAADQEQAVRELESALRANGESVALWSQRLQDAASELQRITVFGDEFILQQQKMLLNLGVTADQLDEATRASIGLAVAMGSDLKSAVRNYSLALSGNFLMLNRYIPAVREANNVIDKLAALNEFAAKGFEQAQAETETFRGATLQLKNAIGDLGELLGDVFIPSILEAVKKIHEVIPAIQMWVKENSSLILTITKWTAGMAAALVLIPTLIAGILGVVKVLALLKTAALAASAAMAALARNPIIAAIGLLATAIAGVAAWLITQESAAKDAGIALEKYVTLADKLNSLQDAFLRTETLEEERENLEKQLQVMRQLTQGTRDYSEAISDLERRLENVNNAMTEAIGPESTAEQRKLIDDIAEMSAKLKEQADTWGLSAERISLFRLRARGALDEQLAGLVKVIEKTEALRESQERAADAERRLVDGKASQKTRNDETSARARDLLLASRTQSQILKDKLSEIEALRIVGALTDAQARRLSAVTANAARPAATATAPAFESLTELQRRISGAAGSVSQQPATKTASNTASIATSTSASAKTNLKLNDIVSKILEFLQNAGAVVGVFGE